MRNITARRGGYLVVKEGRREVFKGRGFKWVDGYAIYAYGVCRASYLDRKDAIRLAEHYAERDMRARMHE